MSGDRAQAAIDLEFRRIATRLGLVRWRMQALVVARARPVRALAAVAVCTGLTVVGLHFGDQLVDAMSHIGRSPRWHGE